jgi:hypothetical protein
MLPAPAGSYFQADTIIRAASHRFSLQNDAVFPQALPYREVVFLAPSGLPGGGDGNEEPVLLSSSLVGFIE